MFKLSWVFVFVMALVGCGGGGSSDAQAAAPAAPLAAPTPQALQVYLFLGQSNMVGVLGNLSELPQDLRAPQQAVAFLNGSWQPYVAGAPVSACLTAQPCFGPEVSFAAAKGPVGIVKFAVSGTGLAADWLPTMLSQAIASARAAAGARPVHFAGAFWMQGESEALSVDLANAYAANLRTLVGRLRTELPAPELPFTVCRINVPARDTFGNLYPGRDIVRAAQENPGITNYRMVDCDGLPHGPDALHFTTAGIVQMGDLFAGATP